MSVRTYEELRGTRKDSGSTLAYWLGNYAGTRSEDELLQVSSDMAFQYDIEEQAGDGIHVLCRDEWAEWFSPVAPVQLTLSWSPVPRAIEVLGMPTHETTYGEWALCSVSSWTASSIAKISKVSTASKGRDEKRFLALLTVAVSRAQERRHGLMLVAKPGWSYDHADVQQRAQRAMKKAGFVVSTRK